MITWFFWHYLRRFPQCEKKLLQEELNDDFFVEELKKNISELDGNVNNKLVDDMILQGNKIIPEIEDALSDYFDEYEVLAVEMPLMEKIETFHFFSIHFWFFQGEKYGKKYAFAYKGYIDTSGGPIGFKFFYLLDISINMFIPFQWSQVDFCSCLR